MSGPISLPFVPPLIQSNPVADALNRNHAKWMHERVVRSINSFEETLNQDQEVGARLVSFGSALTFHILDVGYRGPDLITFHGETDEGNRVELLQHISQLSVLLMAMPKAGERARRIGFTLVQGLEANESQ